LNIDIDVLYLILPGIFFIIGFLISYIQKLQSTIVNKTLPLQQNNNLEIIEIIENKKQLQIDNIMLKLKDIQIKLDLLESKLSTIESQPQYGKNTKNSENITNKYDITSQAPKVVSNITDKSSSKISPIGIARSKSLLLNEKHNATEHYILKIILKDSLTSNEIKKAIGRTREHTSRLLKKLYELQLVDRDITTKPFRYKLTEQGREYIEEQVKNKEINQDNTLNSSSYANDTL
jgi:DNA-binding MarR family transcriptional regulator